jgi:predicted ABC-type ATPase
LESLFAATGAHGLLSVINPDQWRYRNQELGHAPESQAAQRKAAEWADNEMRRLIHEKQSFIRESVFSTERLLPILASAQSAGFRLTCIYIITANPTLNVGRVAQRVKLGGHGVPEAKIRQWWGKSIANILKLGPMADHFMVLDHPATDPSLSDVLRKLQSRAWGTQ